MAVPAIGPLGMPDNQFKAAMINTSSFAAQGTGTAKKQAESEKMEHHQEDHQLEDESITLSDQAQKEAKQASEQEAEQQSKETRDERQLRERRTQSASGHAAMATGAKDKDKMKEVKGEKPPAADEGDPLTMLESAETEIGQASITGTLDEETKKLRGKRKEEDLAFGGGDVVKRNLYGSDSETVYPKQPEVKPEVIEKAMNRDPEEILKDVPPQFKATAQMMVKGQIHATGQPKETLTVMKPEPRVECSALELMPEKELDIMDISVEAPPIPDLAESGSMAAS
jgi:hypothetical protein